MITITPVNDHKTQIGLQVELGDTQIEYLNQDKKSLFFRREFQKVLWEDPQIGRYFPQVDFSDIRTPRYFFSDATENQALLESGAYGAGKISAQEWEKLRVAVNTFKSENANHIASDVRSFCQRLAWPDPEIYPELCRVVNGRPVFLWGIYTKQAGVQKTLIPPKVEKVVLPLALPSPRKCAWSIRWWWLWLLLMLFLLGLLGYGVSTVPGCGLVPVVGSGKERTNDFSNVVVTTVTNSDGTVTIITNGISKSLITGIVESRDTGSGSSAVDDPAADKGGARFGDPNSEGLLDGIKNVTGMDGGSNVPVGGVAKSTSPTNTVKGTG